MSDESDMDQIMLNLMVQQGFLEKQVAKNGKVWYKRTSKPIPDRIKEGK